MPSNKPTESPGKREQDMLREDPALLAKQTQGSKDPALETTIEKRRDDALSQQVDAWWAALDKDEALRYLHQRDELLLLLHEKYRYTRGEASSKADYLLRTLVGPSRD